MKKEYEIIRVESHLSFKKMRGIILNDPLFYKEQNEIETLIIKFILSHFWEFISDFKKKFAENYLESRNFESNLYYRILEEDLKPIEFPYTENRTRGGGGYGYGIKDWSKMSKIEQGQYHSRKSLLDDDLRKIILKNITPRIFGNICYEITDTSVGKAIGIKAKTAGVLYIKSTENS